MTREQKAEEDEERAEGVGAAADPGYGFGVDGEGKPEERCRCRDDERCVETAQETESEEAVCDVEEKVSEVEASGIELPEVAVNGKGDPVEGTVGETAGSAEVGGEGDGSEKEAVGEGVPVGEGGIVEDLVEIIVEERCADGIPVKGEDP